MKSKKIVASLLTGVMVMSVCSCAMFDKDDEAVLAAADAYATAIKKVKVSKIIDLLIDGDDHEEYLESLTNGYVDQQLPEGYDDICDAIAGTISYEIDEETVESSKKNAEASVDITYTLVDYNAVYDEVTTDGGDLEAFIDALEDSHADTIEITQTMELVLEDGEWLVEDNRNKNINEVYAFYDDALDFIFVPPLIDYINYTEWYYSDNSVYTNVERIELDLITTSEGEYAEFEFTYEYYYNGELIYTSDTWYDQGHWIEAYYGPSYDPNAPMDGSYLAAGEYRCVMFDLDGNVLADSTCTVENYGQITPTSDLVDELVWYYSDDGVYTDFAQIELDIIPTDLGQSIEWEFWYEYYIDGELVFTSDECWDSGYYIESYYGPYHDPDAEVRRDGCLIPGEYTCVVYNMDGEEIARSTCTVE